MTTLRRWFRKWFLGWVECPTCDRLVPPYNFGIHSDGHFDQEQVTLRDSLEGVLAVYRERGKT